MLLSVILGFFVGMAVTTFLNYIFSKVRKEEKRKKELIKEIVKQFYEELKAGKNLDSFENANSELQRRLKESSLSEKDCPNFILCVEKYGFATGEQCMMVLEKARKIKYAKKAFQNLSNLSAYELKTALSYLNEYPEELKDSCPSEQQISEVKRRILEEEVAEFVREVEASFENWVDDFYDQYNELKNRCDEQGFAVELPELLEMFKKTIETVRSKE